MLRVSASSLSRACRGRSSVCVLPSSSAVLGYSGPNSDEDLPNASSATTVSCNSTCIATVGSSLSTTGFDALSLNGMSRRTMSTSAGEDVPDTTSSTFDTMTTAEAATPTDNSSTFFSFGTQEDPVLNADGLREALPFEPNWYNLPDQVITWLNFFADATGLPYAVCIAGTTVAIRIAVFPLFVKAQQNTSRMAHMKPEMDILKERIDRAGSSVSQEEQMQHAKAMKGLFKKYDCNPLKALAVPFVQAPVFMSMFFGLRKMPDYFPNELASGGVLWFPDLTAPDPLYIMPVASALMFIGMMEVGKAQMIAGNPQQGPIMLNAFRGLGVAMIPITINFSTAIFCYWTTNNLISLGQSFVFKNKNMRKRLGIWDPPPPVPGQENSKGFMESMTAAFDKSDTAKAADKIKLHNEAIERQKTASQASLSVGERKAGRNRKRGKKSR